MERDEADDGADLRVVPATLDHWDFLSALFMTSPGVARCWCMWPLHPPRTFCPDRAANMAAMKTLLRSGEIPGLLAITAERALGWCAVGPRHQYPQYESRAEGAAVWAIPCIYIQPAANRRLVARRLIEAAVELATRNAAMAIEGPPPWWLPGDAAAVDLAAMTFTDNGFTSVGRVARMPELRRMLA